MSEEVPVPFDRWVVEFRLFGAALLVGHDAMIVGFDLWSGMCAEHGQRETERLLRERLDAAALLFGVPPGPLPTPECIAASMPAGLVMVSSAAALLAGGWSVHPRKGLEAAP